MALKKSELYSFLWASCDELRGGMDASQYKDYVLFMLFIKYISDKYGTSADFAPTNINQQIADAIPVELPPTVLEQTAIAAVLLPWTPSSTRATARSRSATGATLRCRWRGSGICRRAMPATPRSNRHTPNRVVALSLTRPVRTASATVISVSE